MSRLVIVSNRTPSLTGPAAGGMAVALANALHSRGGLWFGWSGDVSRRRSDEARVDVLDGFSVASVDLTKSDHHGYYCEYANQVLWPTFHYRVDLAKHEPEAYRTYESVNEYFADRLAPLLRADDLIWVHDYHLIPLAGELRKRGIEAPIGFFMHIPLPVPEVLATIPEHGILMRSMLAYDLIGFQTRRDMRAFANYVTHEMGGTVALDGTVQAAGRRVKAHVFPIGIDPDGFASMARSALTPSVETQLHRRYGPGDLILGVDRLDYSKGLTQRFRTYEALLDEHPELQGRVAYLQIAAPSRSQVPEYQAERKELDAACGRINGRFSDHDWHPVHYVNRAYPQHHLAGLYRFARVGLVTPMWDGMNLVAKEFVASQDPQDPGVLVLSRFAGAAEQLDDALLVNPHDTREVAASINRALTMPLKERRDRWVRLMTKLRNNTIDDWRDAFVEALSRTMPLRMPGTPEESVMQILAGADLRSEGYLQS